MHDWILESLVHYALLAAGLGLCLYLFASLKAEMRSMKRRLEEREHVFQQAKEELLGRMEQAETALKEALRQMEVETPAYLPKNDMYLAKRTQAIRMNRRGESASTIAGALEVPRNEVELLLKVQRLLTNPPSA